MYQNIRRVVIGLSVLFVVVGITFALTRHFFPNHIIGPTTTKIVYKDTTIYRDTTIYKPIPVKVEVPVEVPVIPEDYESLKTLYTELYMLYNTLTRYEERISLDTIGEVNIQFTVSKNSLDSLNAVYSYKVYEKIITETTYLYKNNWYLYGGTNFNSISLGVLYTTPGYMVGAGYNFNEKSAQVSLGININKLWK